MMRQSRHTQTEPAPTTGPPQFRDAILGLLRILEAPEVDLEAVARAIRRDPGLSELPRPLDSARFWSFALATAVCARTLARDLGCTHPGRALSGGLLHRLGVLLVAGTYPERFTSALELAKVTQIEIDQALECEFGTPHSELCADTLRSWGVSESLATGIAHCAQPERTNDEPLLALALWNASWICREFGLAEEAPHDERNRWHDALPEAMDRELHELAFMQLRAELLANSRFPDEMRRLGALAAGPTRG